MGDEILKTLSKIILPLCSILISSYAQEQLSLDNEVKSYDKIFEKIAERRSGADVVMIDKLSNPFIVIYSDGNNSDANASTQVTSYILEATFDQKAKINGTWYKRLDTVGAYKLTNIRHDSVILRNEIEKKELLIRTKDESNVKIFSK